MPALAPDLLSLLRAHPAGLAKFDEMVGWGELEVVCENERTRTL